MTKSNNDLNVAEFAAKLIRMVDTEGEVERILRIRQWFLNAQFYRDFHYGTFNAQGVYQTLPEDEMEDLRYTSDFMFSIESQATQWTQSSPELSVDETSDDNQAKAIRRHVEKELEPYRERYWTDIFKQSQAKFAMLSTCYFINTRPKVDENASVTTTKFEDKQVSSPSTYYCEKCGVATAEGERCPDCGGEMASSPGYDANVPVPNGTQSVPEIDIDVELVDPTEIKIDPKCRAGLVSMADWMRRERYLRDYEAEEMYPDWQSGSADGAGQATQRSDALEYKRALEMSMGGQTMTSQENDSGRVLQRQYWFDKKTYRNYTVPADCKYGGYDFKAGDKLIDRFPDGWYINQYNGKTTGTADKPGLFNEDKNVRWVGGVDTVDPTSPYGRGRTGLRNLQEMKDEGVSLGFAYFMRAVLGTTIYDPMGIESSDYVNNRVGGAIPLKPGFNIEGRGIDKAMINVPYQTINDNFIAEFLTVIDEAMPKAGGGTYDVLGGGQGEGAGAKTLGGQTQQLQTSAGMVGPALQLRTQAEIECFFQYLELRQQYGSDASFKEIAGSWGDADAEAFRKCRDEKGKSLIRKMVKIVATADSEIPVTQNERRTNIALALTSGLADSSIPILPNVRKYGLEQLRIPIEDDLDEQGKRVAETLLEKMKQAAKYAGQMSEQMQVQPQPEVVAQAIAAVAPLMKQRDDNSLPIFKAVFGEFLRSAVDATEGIDADPALQLAVQLKLDEIEQFDMMLAGDMVAKQTMTQAPAAMAQQALEQQGQQQEDPNAQAEADKGVAEQGAAIQTDQNQQSALMTAHQAETQQQSQAADHAENAKQRQHDSKEAALQRSHDLAMAKTQAKKSNHAATR